MLGGCAGLCCGGGSAAGCRGLRLLPGGGGRGAVRVGLRPPRLHPAQQTVQGGSQTGVPAPHRERTKGM